MSEKKNILFTFDYELFLGERSGNVQECLINPVEQILEILAPYKIKGIFFVDTTYLLRLKEVCPKDALVEEDLKLIFLQLRRLIKEGHYLFIHLHPHWLNAVYLADRREWHLADLSKYRFHNLDSDKRHYLFAESIKILQEVILPINPDYQVNAYRAGGWSIEPFLEFRPFFEKFNIRYDFSVLPGVIELSTTRRFDYSGLPYDKSIYNFSDSVIQEDKDGQFTEFCISVLPVKKIIGLLNKIWLKIIYQICGKTSLFRGVGVPDKNNLKNKYYETASLDLMTAVKLPFYLDFLKNKNYLQLASHPKMVSRHNLSTLRRFLKHIYARYQIETDFHKMI